VIEEDPSWMIGNGLFSCRLVAASAAGSLFRNKFASGNFQRRELLLLGRAQARLRQAG